jgi:hypothetical protein
MIAFFMTKFYFFMGYNTKFMIIYLEITGVNEKIITVIVLLFEIICPQSSDLFIPA